MKKYFSLLCLAALTLVSCDFNASNLEYQDVIGIYEGQGYLTIIVSDKNGYDMTVETEDGPQTVHFDYGDVLVSNSPSDTPIEVVTSYDTNDQFGFFCSVPQVTLNNKKFSIDGLFVSSIPVRNKGNRIVSWGERHIKTFSNWLHDDESSDDGQLDIKTIYVPITTDMILFREMNNDPQSPYLNTEGKGVMAVILGNYTLGMEMLLEDAPGLVPQGLTVSLQFEGKMTSREINKEK